MYPEVHTKDHQLTTSWAKWIQFTLLHSVSCKIHWNVDHSRTIISCKWSVLSNSESGTVHPYCCLTCCGADCCPPGGVPCCGVATVCGGPIFWGCWPEGAPDWFGCGGGGACCPGPCCCPGPGPTIDGKFIEPPCPGCWGTLDILCICCCWPITGVGLSVTRNYNFQTKDLPKTVLYSIQEEQGYRSR